MWDPPGKRIDIKAGVHTVSGYSAHADQGNLIQFVKRIRRKPTEIRIVHGDDKAKRTLARRLKAVAPQARILIPEK